MTIAWEALLVVAAGSAAVAIAVVSLVAFALVGLSRRARPTPGSPPARAGLLLAVGCLGAALLVVGYGLYVIAA